MIEGSCDDYVDWLRHGPLADGKSFRIHRRISDHVAVPKQSEAVVRAVRESMALEAAHD